MDIGTHLLWLVGPMALVLTFNQIDAFIILTLQSLLEGLWTVDNDGTRGGCRVGGQRDGQAAVEWLNSDGREVDRRLAVGFNQCDEIARFIYMYIYKYLSLCSWWIN